MGSAFGRAKGRARAGEGTVVVEVAGKGMRSVEWETRIEKRDGRGDKAVVMQKVGREGVNGQNFIVGCSTDIGNAKSILEWNTKAVGKGGVVVLEAGFSDRVLEVLNGDVLGGSGAVRKVKQGAGVHIRVGGVRRGGRNGAGIVSEEAEIT